MNCKEAINYIHSLEKFGIMPGLERIEFLCNKLGNPQNDLKFIHVAGTNGKGSTSTLISNILLNAGFNVGLYTSPYVIDFRERIQFNGEMIEPEMLALCISRIKEIISAENITSTEFEVITAAAFLYFKMKKCDYVVLEVGLGGRFDATNIIKAPEAAVITSVSLDHVAVLGSSISDIAKEKCGIIKKGSKVISYPFQKTDAKEVIESTCKSNNVSLIIPDIEQLTIESENLYGTFAEYRNINFKLKLPGTHMVYNCITAIETVKSILPELSDSIISDGIELTVMPARTELISDKPIVILDGGHNEDCANALAGYLAKHLSDKRIVAVSSLMSDKDYSVYLSKVLPYVKMLIATQADVPRALPADSLKSEAMKYCDNVISVNDSITAVKAAFEMANKNDVILICGSFYLAGEIREYLIDNFSKENNYD